MTEINNLTALLKNLEDGFTTTDEMNELLKLLEKKHIKEGKTIASVIELLSYQELVWRLKTSVFADQTNSYTNDFKKHCIAAEFHNTLSFIKLTQKIIQIGEKIGDITNPQFYGQPDPGYKVSIKTVIHIFLRHNVIINGFLNKDSKLSKRSPTSFSFSALAEPMILLFMALNVLKDRDWQKTAVGKNLICHIDIGIQRYSILSNRAKQIITFYPRGDDLEAASVKLVRNTDKMEFLRIQA